MKQALPPKPGDLRALAEFTYNYSNRKYGDLMGEIMPNKYIKSTYKGQAKTEDGEVVSYALNEDGQSALEAYEGKIFFDPATGNLYRKQGVQLIKVFDYADIK